jgi:hypothetical protein
MNITLRIENEKEAVLHERIIRTIKSVFRD